MFARFFTGYVRLLLRLFFRDFAVTGLENVPSQGPLLLVANHLNGMVDPLVVMAALPRRLTLTAKNTLSKNPFLRFLIWGLDAVLLHRAQDADKGSHPEANATALAACAERISRGGALLIFPEGQSHSDPGLRPFKSGAARIALDATKRNGVAPTVLPVGLYFTRKDRFRSAVAVRFGRRLEVPALDADDAAAQLTARMDSALRELTLSLSTEEDWVLLHAAAEISLAATRGTPEPGSLVATAEESLRLHKRMAEAYTRLGGRARPDVAALEDRIAAYRERLEGLRLSAVEVCFPYTAARALLFAFRELELVLLGWPMALFGICANFLPYRIVAAVAHALSKDLDHYAQHKIYPAMVIYPLCYGLELFAVSRLGLGWAVGAALLLPWASLYTLLWRERVGEALGRVRTFFRLYFSKGLHRELWGEALAISAEIDRLAREGAAA